MFRLATLCILQHEFYSTFWRLFEFYEQSILITNFKDLENFSLLNQSHSSYLRLILEALEVKTLN